MREYDYYQPLVALNEEKRIYKVGPESASVDLKSMFEQVPETIIDKESLSLIQVEDLHQAIDCTVTATGSATLFRSLMQPPVLAEYIRAKQESVRELKNNTKLNRSVEDYLHEFQTGEQALFEFLNDEINYRDFAFYREIKSAFSSGQNILKAAEAVPTPESLYLQYLVDDIRGLRNSKVYRLMRGPIYKTFHGLRSKEDVYWFTPRLKFRPSSLTGEILAPALPFIALIGGRAVGLIDINISEPSNEFMFWPFVLGFALISAGPFLTVMRMMSKPSSDYYGVIRPLRQKLVKDEVFVGAVDAVGRLDELYSFVQFSQASRYPTTTPTITDDNRHHFTVTDLRNPVLAKVIPNYIPNTVELNGLTVITGPNSGGKSAFCKSVDQTQLMAQIGSDVAASEAVINVADRTVYQAPKFSPLQDCEGSFGAGLRRTASVFHSVSPRSLAILDELAEGTTAEEKIDVSKPILEGFNTIGSTTILVTHNHELANQLSNEGVGHFLQVEFREGKPTFKVIEGISTDSHARQVAERVGLSAKDIEAHLRNQGYLK